jgi:hypothetical protein
VFELSGERKMKVWEWVFLAGCLLSFVFVGAMFAHECLCGRFWQWVSSFATGFASGAIFGYWMQRLPK